jgi:hypothetical protein
MGGWVGAQGGGSRRPGACRGGARGSAPHQQLGVEPVEHVVKRDAARPCCILLLGRPLRWRGAARGRAAQQVVSRWRRRQVAGAAWQGQGRRPAPSAHLGKLLDVLLRRVDRQLLGVEVHARMPGPHLHDVARIAQMGVVLQGGACVASVEGPWGAAGAAVGARAAAHQRPITRAAAHLDQDHLDRARHAALLLEGRIGCRAGAIEPLAQRRGQLRVLRREPGPAQEPPQRHVPTVVRSEVEGERRAPPAGRRRARGAAAEAASRLPRWRAGGAAEC